MTAPPAGPAPRRRLRAGRAVVGVAAFGTLVLLVTAVLPWRSDGMTDPDPFLELVGDDPLLVLPYAVALLAAATTVTLLIINPQARRPIVVVGVTAAIATLLTVLATPLPSGNAIGATPDGRTVEFDVPSYRSWGCYLALAGGLVVLGAALLVGRLRPPS